MLCILTPFVAQNISFHIFFLQNQEKRVQKGKIKLKRECSSQAEGYAKLMFAGQNTQHLHNPAISKYPKSKKGFRNPIFICYLKALIMQKPE